MKIGDKLICKKKYSYNGIFIPNDIFIIEGFNEYNVRLKTKYNTYHNIRYCDKIHNDLYLWNIFYTTQEIRKQKLLKLKHND